MNLQEETDVNKLKAITLDEMDKIAVAQQNIQVLRQRIAQLQEKEAVTETKQPVKASK